MKVITVVFLTSCILLFVSSLLFAQDFGLAQIQYLRGEYKESIKTLEKILAQDVDRPSPAGVYYLLGLSYLKYGNLIRASDCFDIIIAEYRHSDFLRPASIKLIDIDLVREDFRKVLKRCKNYRRRYPKSNLESAVLFREFLGNLKLGNWQAAQLIYSNLKASYPESPQMEEIAKKNLMIDYFSVQVGSFRKRRNAQRLVRILKAKGFDSFLTEGEDSFFRVRVGRFKTRDGVRGLEEKLIKEGYPTKIYP